MQKIPGIKYVIAGKYDEAEKNRVDQLIKELNLQEKVIFAGYINDAEVNDHFQMGDAFIMPSQGEGFGIVFIEAMVCGAPVIAGNQDGSVDALQNGKLGTLVNPLDLEEISAKVIDHYNNRMNFQSENKQKLQQQTLSYFGYPVFKERLKNLLN